MKMARELVWIAIAVLILVVVLAMLLAIATSARRRPREVRGGGPDFPGWVDLPWEEARQLPDFAGRQPQQPDWAAVYAELAPLTKAPHEYAGRFTVVGGAPVVTELRPGDADHIPPEVAWDVAERAADYEFHTHPAAYGPPADYPSAEDLVEDSSKLALGFLGSVIVTPAGVIRVTRTGPAPPLATREQSREHALEQRRLYVETTSAGRPIGFAELAAIAARHGLLVEYVHGTPPTAPCLYDANETWLRGLDMHIEQLSQN